MIVVSHSTAAFLATRIWKMFRFSLFTFMSRWTMLCWWMNSTPWQICRMKMAQARSVKMKSSSMTRSNSSPPSILFSRKLSKCERASSYSGWTGSCLTTSDFALLTFIHQQDTQLRLRAALQWPVRHYCPGHESSSRHFLVVGPSAALTVRAAGKSPSCHRRRRRRVEWGAGVATNSWFPPRVPRWSGRLSWKPGRTWRPVGDLYPSRGSCTPFRTCPYEIFLQERTIRWMN